MVTDTRIALSLARRYRPHERPGGWSRELGHLVSLAYLEIANKRRSEMKARAADIDNGR